MNKNTKQATASTVEAVPTEKQEVKSLSIVKSADAQKVEDTNFEVLEVPKKRSISEVMKLVQSKYSVFEKLEILNQTEKNLDSFNFGKDNLRDQLQILDGEGNKFQTFNTQIIEKVIQVLKAEIEAKRISTELELAEGL